MEKKSGNKSLLRSRGLFIPVLCLVVVVIGLMWSRTYLWRAMPSLRSLSAVLFVVSPMKGAHKNDVLNALGEPYSAEFYGIVHLNDNNAQSPMTGDMVIRFDEQGKILDLHYLWADYVAPGAQEFSVGRWRSADAKAKVLLAQDLIERWRTGEMREVLANIDDAYILFNPLQLINTWKYDLGNWEDFVVEFDKSNRVVSMTIKAE